MGDTWPGERETARGDPGRGERGLGEGWRFGPGAGDWGGVLGFPRVVMSSVDLSSDTTFRKVVTSRSFWCSLSASPSMYWAMSFTSGGSSFSFDASASAAWIFRSSSSFSPAHCRRSTSRAWHCFRYFSFQTGTSAARCLSTASCALRDSTSLRSSVSTAEDLSSSSTTSATAATSGSTSCAGCGTGSGSTSSGSGSGSSGCSSSCTISGSGSSWLASGCSSSCPISGSGWGCASSWLGSSLVSSAPPAEASSSSSPDTTAGGSGGDIICGVSVISHGSMVGMAARATGAGGGASGEEPMLRLRVGESCPDSSLPSSSSRCPFSGAVVLFREAWRNGVGTAPGSFAGSRRLTDPSSSSASEWAGPPGVGERVGGRSPSGGLAP
eukprot:Sspe_Gene.73762::Locus_44833_Transcript_1_1_Confidence_1.000_Length_1351::g.73762::m.73762